MQNSAEDFVLKPGRICLVPLHRLKSYLCVQVTEQESDCSFWTEVQHLILRERGQIKPTEDKKHTKRQFTESIAPLYFVSTYHATAATAMGLRPNTVLALAIL